ncbi:hypothetical protein [Olleya namhaensis]|uniref:hypothetical protein n=1 Tax=Olleya namhaensis TaxID=1144750 RepID=UPI00248FBE02|nr:hypothetical protein [Olleya namhaensis]
MSNKIIIIGGIGTAVNIAEQIQDAKEKFDFKDEFIGYAFDDESFNGEINGYPILSNSYNVYEKYKDQKDVKFIYQLYRPDKLEERTALLNTFNIPLERFYTFVHPLATVAKSAKLGFGNAIHANCVINVNSKIGNHNTLNSNCLIGHDTTIGNNNFFAAHSCVGSNIKIEDYVFVGLNAALNNFIKVESNVMIGMGSNVIKSIESNQLVLGNPAKFIRKLK